MSFQASPARDTPSGRAEVDQASPARDTPSGRAEADQASPARETSACAYAGWWHDGTANLGLSAALDMRRVAQERTARHEVEVFAHERLGWAFALDGRLQHVEADAALREMLAHVPLLGRTQRPTRVLVVGGGDGAVLHEVLKHPFVTRVDVLEPEPALARVAALLGLGAARTDPRVTVHASLKSIRALARSGGGYDVVLLERPLHPLSALGPLVAEAGVLVDWDLPILTKSGPRWYRRRKGVEHSEGLTAEERYHVSSPLLPGGFAGFSLHTKAPACHGEPRGTVEAQHYTPDLHRAAFALPAFWSELP